MQNLNLLIEKLTKIISVAIIISRKIRQGQGRNYYKWWPTWWPAFYKILKNVADALQEDAMLDKAQGFEGRSLTMILAPSAALKKQILNKDKERAKA